MHLIGCDFHTRFQQIAMVDSVTGEILNRRLDHGAGKAHRFYAALQAPARIGMEATGRTQWFERLLAEQGHELWVGDARRRSVRGWSGNKRPIAVTPVISCSCSGAWSLGNQLT